jgi:hypothetical protein
MARSRRPLSVSAPGASSSARADPHESHELVDVAPVGAPRPWVVDVRKPLGLVGHRRQPLELKSRQAASTVSPGEPAAHHRHPLPLSLVRGIHRDELPATGRRRRLTSRAPCSLLPPFFALSHPPIVLLITYFINSTRRTKAGPPDSECIHKTWRVVSKTVHSPSVTYFTDLSYRWLNNARAWRL